MQFTKIGKRREVFWDTYFLDTERTTAKRRVNSPTLCDTVFQFDKTFDAISNETHTISYPILLKVGDTYRLYYQPCRKECVAKTGEREVKLDPVLLCVIESRDGVHWTRPALTNFTDADGNPTNIVFHSMVDGAFLFYDENPACPVDEKFKAMVMGVECDENGTWTRRWLRCYTSPDGYTFSDGFPLKLNDDAVQSEFDSINLALWLDGEYVLYFRRFEYETGRTVRAIYHARSKDFRTWTECGPLVYADGKEYEMYTNQVMRYPRAPHVFVGFPTRYVERKAYTPNMTEMPSYPIKKAASELNPPDTTREGLVVTDCLFMCSRDGKHWQRYCEAYMSPGYENTDNWIYGDCYPSYGFADIGDENYYFYTIDNHLTYGSAKPLNRWKIRKDGFAYIEADDDGAVVVTKPFTFEGEKLHLNFETSCAGSIYVDLLDGNGNEIEGKSTFEIFGNTIDREIFFADGTDFAPYAGKVIRLRFRMRDAKLYSMWFV